MNAKKEIEKLADHEGFEKIFREYFVPLTHYSYKMVKDMDSAKEIVHSVFIRIWEKRKEIHSNVPLRSYLFTAVHNRTLNYLRDSSKFTLTDPGKLSEIEIIDQDDAEEMEDSELLGRMMNEINNLPERCAEVFKLAKFENKKYKEIARELDISVKTVEVQMSKALRILREKLKYLTLIIILWIISEFIWFQ